LRGDRICENDRLQAPFRMRVSAMRSAFFEVNGIAKARAV